MPKERNKAIGKVECPQKGCTLPADVFKFRASGKNPNEWARRHAGKLYCRCSAGHESKDQSYILDRGEIWGDASPPAAAAADQQPAKADSSAKPKPRDSSEETGRASPVSPKQETKPPPPQQQKAKRGIGFFQF